MIKDKIFRAILPLAILISMYSCEKDEEMWYHNQFVFLEHESYVDTEFLKGVEFYVCGGGPTYSFDPSTKILTDRGDNVYMDKSIQIVLGSPLMESGPNAMGVLGPGLYPIKDLPCDFYDFKITKLEEDGTVHFSYKDTTMVLLPNEEWLSTSSSEIREYLDENGNISSRVRYTYTERITNWGLLMKESFKYDSYE